MFSRLSFLIRVIIDIVLCFAILQGWWHAALIAGIIGLIFCRNYFEIIIAGIAYDALFHPVIGTVLKNHAAAIVAVCAYAVTMLVRSFVRRQI